MSQIVCGEAGCVTHTQRDRCGWVVWVGDLPNGLPGGCISSLTVICIGVAIRGLTCRHNFLFEFVIRLYILLYIDKYVTTISSTLSAAGSQLGIIFKLNSLYLGLERGFQTLNHVSRNTHHSNAYHKNKMSSCHRDKHVSEALNQSALSYAVRAMWPM